MVERVVVTGLGVVSSLGCSLDEFWSGLISGQSGISKVASFDTSGLERHYAGEVKNYEFSQGNGKNNNILRTRQFALQATRDALSDAKVGEPGHVGIALGSIVAGLELIENRSGYSDDYPVNMATAHVYTASQLGGSAFTLSCACAAGNYAIGLAYERIRRGQEKIIVAGGVDYFAISTFIGFYRFFSLAPLRCQPFDKNRKGLLPAEGAAMLVLESLSSARQRGAHIYAEVLGYGTSVDAYHPVIPSQEGVVRCMEDTLEGSGLDISDIDYINAHGTGTIPNDKIEAGALKQLFGKKFLKKIPVSSIKSMLGHAMGAASALEAISCCLTIEKKIIPPTINYETPDPECDIDCVPNTARQTNVSVAMNNSFGFGGMNCSVIFARYPSG